MSLDEIKKVIPHRPPFLLIDEILELVPGKKVVAKKHVKPTESWFAGHFPGNPVQPGVLTIEMLAQAGAVCLLSEPTNKGKLALFGGIEKARFKKQIKPNDIVTLHVEIVSSRGPIGFGDAIAKVDGNVAVKARIMFALSN